MEDEKTTLKKQYDVKYDELFSQSKETEKKVVRDYNEDSNVSKNELSKIINSIKETYESDKEGILKNKIQDTKNLEREHKNKMTEFAQNYDDHPYIWVTQNFGKTGYEAVARE